MPLGSLVRLALVQFSPIAGGSVDNINAAKILVGNKKADVFLFPHLFASASETEESARYAEDGAGPSAAFLKVVALERKAYSIGSYVAKGERGKKPTFRTAVFNPDGIRVAIYDQIHLSSIKAEPDYIAPGSKLPFFDVLTFRSSAIGSYDLRFPELAREFGLSWGFLLFVCGSYKLSEIHQWDALLQARACENQMFAIGCNFGQEKKKESNPLEFGGHSAVYAPDGRMLHRAGMGEQVLVLDINPFEVEWNRNRHQYLTDAKVERGKRHVFESEDDPDK